jgi:hypothetical protein
MNTYRNVTSRRNIWAQLMSLRPSLRAFARAEAGAAAVYFVLTAPVWIGGLGLGFEVGTWYYLQQNLQSTADTVADSLAGRVGVGVRRAELQTLADALVAGAGFPGTATFDVTPDPSETVFSEGATVTVTVTRQVSRLLTGFFRPGNFEISSRAVASVTRATPGCVPALGKRGNDSLVVDTGSVSVSNCEVLSNSADDGFRIVAAATLTTDCARTAGHFFGKAPLVTCEGGPRQEAGFTLDPYANRTEPDLTGLTCTKTAYYTVNNTNPMPPNSGTIDGTPYWYFCGGLSILKNLTLQAGLYIIKGNSFELPATINLAGTGVTFYFAQGSSPLFYAPTPVSLNLRAPTTGPYAGILFFGGRQNAATNLISVASNSVLDGALYFPAALLMFTGSGSFGGCTQIIGRKVQLSGSFVAPGPCTSEGTVPIVASRNVTLTE